MKLKYGLLFFIIMIFALQGISQQKMTVKPDDYKLILNNYSNSVLPFPYSISEKNIVTGYPNIRVFPSNINQSCASATLSNINPNFIFAGANTDNGVGYYYSNNGGVTWSGGDLLSGSSLFSTNPSCIYDNTPIIYYNYFDNFIVTDRSYNNGAGWSGRITVPSDNQFDMSNIVVDNKSSSPYYKRVYVGWSNFNFAQPLISISYSTNQGASYISYKNIGQPLAGHFEQGVNLQTGNSGEVFAVWATPNLNSNIEDHIGFSMSVNGGDNWSVPTTPITIGGIRGYLLNSAIRVNSFPSLAVDKSGGVNNGKLYVCWAQKNLAPAGTDADICFSSSANNGSLWSAPVRVNDDALNNGKQQFLPRITIDQTTGKIMIVYYDTRDFLANDSCNIYMAVSADGGNTFSNIKISDHSHRPAPLAGYADGYYSDYVSVTAQNDVVHPFWTDNRNGVSQLYTTNITLKPYISHSPLKDSENLTGPYVVNASIISFGTNLIAGETKVFWGRGGITDSIIMTNSGGNNWTASIPGNGTQNIYRYYIQTKDANGRYSTLPDNAPTGYFSFNVGTDVTKPVITHIPKNFVPYTLWPDTLKATVSDNTGLDSVWVVWYKNNPGTGLNEFKLNLVMNDIFRGIFNSSQSLVEPSDSVFYKIFARDNSSNHNTDSTILYKLLISNILVVTLGSGTAVASYPYRTFYTDSRTDMLYTASEINAQGGALSRIMGIAFNVLNASPQMMSGFNLKIQNTSLTSLTGFTSTGWVNEYSFNYTVPGTGWQYIAFQTPFIWNGTSNLLVEICFNNIGFNANTNVAATPVSNMTWHQAQDLPSGNGCTDLNAGTTQVNRPDISFVLNSILAVENQGTTIPKEYKLSQNYPNPFNPKTRINYSIPAKDFVSLKIYDILGREISTLVKEIKSPGNYTVEFNADEFSSGVYFYRLETTNFSDTKRMILVK